MITGVLAAILEHEVTFRVGASSKHGRLEREIKLRSLIGPLESSGEPTFRFLLYERKINPYASISP